MKEVFQTSIGNSNAQANVPIEPNAFHTASAAFSDVADLHNRLRALRERLVGSFDEDKPSQLASVPSGLFGVLDSSARVARNLMGDMHQMLSAIEQKLP